MNNIPLVDIDSNGVFKYILVRIDCPDDHATESFEIVRGSARFSWHADIFEDVISKLGSERCEVLGGGRISHDPVKKEIHVYGYSQAYGQADHEVTALKLKQVYSDYTISTSNEGY